MDCQCHDGVVCFDCAAKQLTQLLDTPPNPALTEDEVQGLQASVGSWLETLGQGPTPFSLGI